MASSKILGASFVRKLFVDGVRLAGRGSTRCVVTTIGLGGGNSFLSIPAMFIRRCFRTKNGKRRAYSALVESSRTERAMPELLGVPATRVANNRLYRALDQLLPHKA